MLPFIPNLMNMLISTFLNLSGYLNLFIQAVYCSYCDLWVWVEFVIKWLVGCLPQMCLFKGKLEETRCHTDTGHMHVGLKRISVYNHYSVTLRIAVLTRGCEPPPPHLASHFRSRFFRGTLFAAALDLAVLHRQWDTILPESAWCSHLQIFLSQRHHFQPNHVWYNYKSHNG